MSQIFYAVLMEKRASAVTPINIPLSEVEAQMRDAMRTYRSFQAGEERMNSLIHPITGGAVGAVGGGLYGMNVGPQQAGETDEQYASRRRMGAAKGAIGGTLIGTAFGTHVTPEIERLNTRRLGVKHDEQRENILRIVDPHHDAYLDHVLQKNRPQETNELWQLHNKITTEDPGFRRYFP